MSTEDRENILSDEEVRKLVLARLSILSPDTIVSLGADGSFTRDQLLDSVEQGDSVGNKIAQIQMQWLQSFKEGMYL